jgi:hypothetical protein
MRRQLAADLYKGCVQANSLTCGGLPDAMWCKRAADWAWDTADALLDADGAPRGERAQPTVCAIDGCDSPRIVGSPRCRFHD